MKNKPRPDMKILIRTHGDGRFRWWQADMFPAITKLERRKMERYRRRIVEIGQECIVVDVPGEAKR